MDNKALIVKNEINLPTEVQEKMLRLASVGSISYLSPEKESGPFLLYCCGEDFESIALKVNLPVEIIYLTAMHYKWHEKSKLVRQDPESLQKDLANSILVATYLAAKEQLEDVLSGRKKASQCPLIPKNIHSLEKLMAMVNDANGIVRREPNGTTIHAQNVQINNNKESEPKEIEPKKEREAKYKMMKESAKK